MSARLVRRTVRVALALVMVALSGLLGGAGVIAVRPSAESSAAEEDIRLTMQARRVLALDRELGLLNLGVRVHNRVATLWGPVPSAELAFRAEVCLRGLVELLEVRNDLWVNGDNLTMRPGLTPQPPAFLPPPPPPTLPGLPSATAPPLAPRPAEITPIPLMPDDALDLPPVRLPKTK